MGAIKDIFQRLAWFQFWKHHDEDHNSDRTSRKGQRPREEVR